MRLGVPKESRRGETRFAMAPEVVKKLARWKLDVIVERGAGESAGFSDSDFEAAGAKVGSREECTSSDIVFQIHPPTRQDIESFKPSGLLISHLEPYSADAVLSLLAAKKVNSVSMEAVPRTSRAQSMDALSSQANIAGYRAVLEATRHFQRFFPLMMTSAGSSRPAKVLVLGVGVAGLQAIATAKRLGAQVTAYDIRAETKEQVKSLGAKFLELDIGEEGSGQGGYARELSEDAQKRQQEAFESAIQAFDVLITTANIPGRKAPILVTERGARGLRRGSVIVDMAAANGGNCPLSRPDEIVDVNGVKIVGYTNYPAMVATDASTFYARNLMNLLELFIEQKDSGTGLRFDFEDDIVAASLLVYEGEIRLEAKR